MVIKVKTHNNTVKVPFEKLAIGECYKDGARTLCIKTTLSRCIYLDDETGLWSDACENPKSNVTPVQATLTIEE